ncbi:MAG: type VI secretion protein IcmF/TssM N-terminal domain-containing protein [Holophaga sp.]|nr:type VI secretion protein IcmF/TssM N-terminal domain-containing protein [Holophaga sp.]
MKRLLKILLVAVLLGGAGFACFRLTVYRHWPWWVGAGLFLGCLGLWLLALFLVHHLRRRREAAFVRRVIAEDEAAIHSAAMQERQALRDLQEHWAESMDLLRNSRLRKRGNPLYVLPWYLVLGESRAGKTSAIRHSGLASAVGKDHHRASTASTRNCDWWFFDQAIILDTAGRYSINVDEELDREEWRRFLTLLAQYRRKEPVNGVIVVVPADQLLSGSAEKLRGDALDLRRRIDTLARSLGATAPVFVMVTKMDQVPGMTAFAAALQERVTQAMGYTNQDKDPHWREVFQRAMASTSSRLRELRFALARQDSRTAPGVLLFPAEFQRLKPGLEQFLQPLFQDNPYLETPLLRGLFFSSAVRTGSPGSEFLDTFGLRDAQPATASQGLFLQEFFSTILPRDRHLHRAVQEFLSWRRLRRNLGLVAWSGLWLGALGLLGASFQQNRRALRAFTDLDLVLPTRTGDTGADLLKLDWVRRELTQMKRLNRGWWVPRLGLDHSLRLERTVEASWLNLFRADFLTPMDITLDRELTKNPVGLQQGDKLAIYLGFLVTRIDLIQHTLDDGPIDVEHGPAWADAFTAASRDLLASLHPGLDPDAAHAYADNYLGYLVWASDRGARQAKIQHLRENLKGILGHEGVDLRWIASNWIPDAPHVGLRDFWGGTGRPLAPGPLVAGAFTRGGRNHIQAFLKMMERALGGPALLQPRLAAFWAWYRAQFYRSWFAFGQRFAEGARGIAAPEERERIAALMAIRDNPYLKLLDRMALEMGSLEDPAPAPAVALVLRLNRIQDLAEEQTLEKSNPSTLDKLVLEKDRQLRKWEGRLDPEKAEDFQLCMAASKLWLDYLAAFQAIEPTLLSRQEALRQMVRCLGDQAPDGLDGDPGASSLYLKAHAKLTELEVFLGRDSDTRAVWSLVRGPLDHAMAYSLDLAAADLQAQWSRSVLGPLRDTDPDRFRKVLFDPQDGKVWSFLKGPARAFVENQAGRHAAKEAFNGQSLPFRDDFFAFLDRGQEAGLAFKPSFNVTLAALPLGVNPAARVLPTGSRLSLSNQDSSQTSLENFNYPQSVLFKWDPETASDVTLQIQLPNLALTRTYPGKLGFARFLGEFERGVHRFSARDFPESEGQLEELGISWIRVGYRVTGAAPVLRFLKTSPVLVPESIVAPAGPVPPATP